jgi:hypothetical protein
MLVSETMNVRDTFAAVPVGVPLIVPLGLQVRPLGKVPLVSVHV